MLVGNKVDKVFLKIFNLGNSVQTCAPPPLYTVNAANLRFSFWQESERAVTKKEGIEFAREYGCLFLECSAKTKVNVEQCFEELVLKVCIGSYDI